MNYAVMAFLPSSRNDLTGVREAILLYKYIILLVLTNLITNYIFILQYKFCSDDWSFIVNPIDALQSYGYVLLYPDRPLYFALLKFQAQMFHDSAIIYHILGFITTSVIIIIVYKIAQKIFSDFNYSSDLYPFLTALIYCVLFNKDELYPFALVALGAYSILYLVSFYTYINKEKEHYLAYSLVTYTLGIFTYESGITLPALYFFYDVITRKDYKKSFLFAFPLAFNLIVRKTQWFGFGHIQYFTGFGQWGIQSIVRNMIDFISASLFIVIRQILYSIQGLQTMSVLLILVVLVDLILIWLLYETIDLEGAPRSVNYSFGLLLLIMTGVFAGPFILRGGLLAGSLPTRSFEFVDIGISFLIVFIITGLISKPKIWKLLLLVFIVICMVLCQGLYLNWVVSGTIQDDVYRFIGNHSGEIQSYDYIYFNTSSFTTHYPNAIDESVFYPVARIYYQYIRHDLPALEARMNAQQMKISGLPGNNEFDRYYNAKGLDNYALASMLAIKTEKFDDRNYTHYLLYGKNMNVPVKITDESITFQHEYPGGENITIDRSRIYEINYEKVYAAG